MFNEKIIKPSSGFFMFAVVLLLLILGIFFITQKMILLGVLSIFAFGFLSAGFFIINPNEAEVLTFFGKYEGTAKDNGFFWVNPLFGKKKISLRARNLNGQRLKVNDKVGNPIEIATVVVWQVEDTARALFNVDDYHKFVDIQSEAAVRHLATTYPYDNIEDDHTSEVTLRGSADQVNLLLEKELNERLAQAGVHVSEARISHLAYAAEIAQAMLQRQQASAIVAARKQIVDGAVGLVEMALDRLREKEIVHLDEERKAAMVSNLLVVLCSDRAVNPVVNTGTLSN